MSSFAHDHGHEHGQGHSHGQPCPSAGAHVHIEHRSPSSSRSRSPSPLPQHQQRQQHHQQQQVSNRTDEERHWFDVMRTFLMYGDFLEFDLSRRQKHLNRLTKKHLTILPELTFDRLGHAQEALNINMDFFQAVVAFYQDSTQDWSDRKGASPGVYDECPRARTA